MISFAFSSILTGKSRPITLLIPRCCVLCTGGVQARRSDRVLSAPYSCWVSILHRARCNDRVLTYSCIGGVGIFLIETGLEVSRGLKEEGFEYNLATLKLFFDSPHDILLWAVPLFLAILLRVITHYNHHQLIFPVYFFVIPIIFYIVIAIGGWDLDHLRRTGWIFDIGGESQAWWKFYTYFVSAPQQVRAWPRTK
jgi:hypothetical protein